jgi:lipopolysaccharide/colanic/teichoic acid biosynthesis glycosyltransferase
MLTEPRQAFPHLPPSQGTRERFAGIFDRTGQIDRWSKNAFDHIVAVLALIIVLPIVFAVFVSHIFICAIFPSDRGPLLIGYKAVSRGTIFLKYKFRVVKQRHIDPSAALASDWHAYASEWDPTCRTYLGQFLKKFYLDEIPQFLNVALGQMSMVGPRPLAVHHYERDLSQGNIHRRLLKAGLFGPSQALKGTVRYGVQDEEYRYLDAVTRMSAIRLLCYDVKLIVLGLVRVAEGKGL